ncbi:MAG: DUF932 domain-containing protein [Bacteroidota bacterium]
MEITDLTQSTSERYNQIASGVSPDYPAQNTQDAVVLADEPFASGGNDDATAPSVSGRGSILPSPDMTVLNDGARRGIWPNSRIEKQQASADGTSLHYAVRIFDADGKPHLASRPGVLLSPDYLLVHNDEMKEMAHEVARLTGHDFVPTRERFTLGRKGGARYEYLLESPTFTADVTTGDTIACGIRALNSYDKSTRARVEVFATRLVCSNGMIARDTLFDFTFEHKVSTNGGREQWREELERAQYELRHLSVNFERFVELLRRLRDVPVGVPELAAFTKKLAPAFPGSTYGEIVKQFMAHEDPTAFGLLNACTYTTWHRGDRVTDADMDRNGDLVALLTSDLFLN